MNLINMHKLPSYEGLECTRVQTLPNVQGVDLVLVKIKDHIEHCVDEIIAVREENITSPSKAKQHKTAYDKRKAIADKLKVVHKEITDYLLGLGMIYDKSDGTYLTQSKSGTVISFDLQDISDPIDVGQYDIDVGMTIYINGDVIDAEYENEFSIKTFSQFKKEVKSAINYFFKDLENRDIKELMRVATEIRNSK